MSCSTILKNQGYRLTPQRRLILDIIHEANSHLTADVILSRLRAKISGVNKSTVYRTLELLEDLGLVVKSEIASTNVYHHAEEGHHHHLVCKKCGRQFHCDEAVLWPLKDSLKEKLGFDADLSYHVICGLCRDCRTERR
jgi:Fur family ferric uptake transcriptional regulator